MTEPQTEYDAIVIGAGMSGLACAIRLGMFDKKVALIEKHSVPGGLNSYFQRVKKDKEGNRVGIRKFDVGLHALTNFAKKGEKNKPLLKILKQLRLRYDSLEIQEQSYSQVLFNEKVLKFTNDIEFLVAQVKEVFSEEGERFEKLVKFVEEFDDTSLEFEFTSTKNELKKQGFSNEFIECLLCPLLFYGSSWENDIDLQQFVILFKSIFMEGFARPYGGVRTLINPLVEKLKDNNVDVRFKTAVKKIIKENNKVSGVELEDGTVLKTNQVYSSVGLPETESLLMKEKSKVGNLTFVECLYVFEKKIDREVNDSTISFFNYADRFNYECPKTPTDFRSGVFCIPDNYEKVESEEGMIRITFIANYDHWNKFSEKEYLAEKEKVKEQGLKLIKKLCPQDNRELLYTDIFTPKTITKFTSHKGGTVYGSPLKKRDGLTETKDLYVIGTDQGYLGIVGSLLSGITMANIYGLKGGL